MEETIYLEAGDTKVTSDKITIGASTYATRNIGSVKVQKVPASGWPILVFILGAAFAINGSVALGAAIMLACAAVAFSQFGKYKLVLLAGAGEVVALVSRDADSLRKLHDAIVQAISAR